MLDGKYRAHAVASERRADGAILLTTSFEHAPVATRATDWLHKWTQATPDAVLVAERSGPGWREVTYAEALESARAISAGLLERGLGPETPILILSGNGVDHALMALGAQYAGVPYVPVAEQYSLIPAANVQLAHVARLVRPRMVFAADGDRYGPALSLDIFDGIERVAATSVPAGVTSLAGLLASRTGAGVDEANAQTGPDTVAKILMTSGSTSLPKGVLTTNRMMCTNQAQLQAALPFLTTRPPVIVDWLPWNHVFGGSHNFNMILANGGALYVDNGKPMPGLVEKTIENIALKPGTIAFNVPVGFAQIRDALRRDAGLRKSYFEDLDMLFYAGASLPQDVWADLEQMAREIRGGSMPLFTSSWGLTETAPGCLLQHEPTTMSGIVGVPLAGVTVKLVPDDAERFEIRVKGPTITPGYFEDPARTAEAFDEEGYFITGDAMKFVDPADHNRGMRFDGRIAEDFKLLTGTWVRAANLRLDLLIALAGLAQDIIVTGADRNEVGLLIVPSAGVRARSDAAEDDGALVIASAAGEAAERLALQPHQGSSTAVRRFMFLAEPPSMAEGEITAKGNLSFRKLLTRRAGLLDRLYTDGDKAVVRVGKG